MRCKSSPISLFYLHVLYTSLRNYNFNEKKLKDAYTPKEYGWHGRMGLPSLCNETMKMPFWHSMNHICQFLKPRGFLFSEDTVSVRYANNKKQPKILLFDSYYKTAEQEAVLSPSPSFGRGDS